MIVFAGLFFLQVLGFGQDRTLNVNAYGVNMSFTGDRTKIKSNELASNVLRIVNNTGKEIELVLQISQPAGWKIFGLSEQKIKIASKDSMFIPVRVRPLYNVSGNTNYIVNAYLSTEQFTITNAVWYIAVDKKSHWNVYTPETKVYFTGNSDTAQFEVQVSNMGNSDEALLVSLIPEKELQILSTGQPTIDNAYPILLKPGHDTTLRFSVSFTEDVKLPINAADEPIKYENKRQHKLKIQVRNQRPSAQGSNKLWTGNIDFVDLPNKTKIMDAAVQSVPMTFEFNTFDMMTPSVFSSLNIYGSKKYKNNSTLTYYYQADFVKNQIDLNSYLGNYLYLGYFHKNFMVEVGDIGSNRPGSTLNGKGIKAGINFKGNTLGGLFIRKPKLFDQYYAEGYGGFHNFKGKRVYIDNYYQHLNNNWQKVAGDFATSDWNIILTRKHFIRFGGGYSLENHFWTTGQEKNLTGYGWKLGYSGNFNKMNLTLNSYYGSKNYTPMRGTFSLTGSARYRINENYTISASGYRFDFSPEIYTFGKLLNDSIYNIQDNYSLKLNYQKDQNVFIFQPRYYTIESNPIASRTRGMAFEYRRLSRSAFKFYANVFAGYTRFDRNPDIKDIFISYVQASFRYNRFQFNTRYYYGPYYTLEQIDYIQRKENPQRIFSTLFYDHWFLNNKIRLNVNLNYFYTTVQGRNQFITRPELFYYAPGGFRFSIYARYSFFGEGSYVRQQYHASSGSYTEELVEASSVSRFEVGAGVKFNVNMPTGIKRYYKVKVIAFRDLNGNGVMDPGEKGIDNMLILLTKNDKVGSINSEDANLTEFEKTYELVTNGKGVVEYDNIPVGEYVITARPLTSMGGWFDGKTFYRTIDKNKEIYIPLSKGARISGGVLTERARYTDNKPVQLGNIRVTAIHTENGKTFSTLTDKDGQFVLFAPNGTYNIMINEQAIGARYEFLQNNIPLTISKDFENYNVSFYLVEKERKMRMNSGTKPTLPINRNTEKTPTTPQIDSNDAPLVPTQLMPVDTSFNKENDYIMIQLFDQEQGRLPVNQFDNLNGLVQVKCVGLKNGGFLYLSENFLSKKEASKALKKVKKAGFPAAKIVNKITD